MERLNLLVCLGLICVASALATVVDPRGARPVEQGTRADKCATQREWPFCTDDEWGSKCPSGCRIQGLMDKYDHSLLKKIEKIRSLLDQNRVKHRSTDQVSKQTYDFLKEKLILEAGNDNNYYDLAQSLRQRITDLKIKIDRQLRILGALKDRVKDQVVEMQRLEVDIDIKLRSCKGSCKGYSEYQVDQESYVALNKQINQLDSHSAQNIETVGTLYVMKSRPLQSVTVDSVFKSKNVEGSMAGQQKADLFPEVKTVHLVLEEEGSSSSPATISKVPDCVEAYQNHLKGETNGLFKIKPGGTDSIEVVEVYCQQEGMMGGWLLVQQRESGALSFNRTWAEYRNGFGLVDAKGKGEFWLGNQNLHLLTNQGETMLKVELEDWEGGEASAEYTIRVGSEDEGYPLHVSGYTGDAGDALVIPKSDMASYLSHNGMKFSTFDKDNDKWEENCAEMYGGGWWYNNCQSANLNGIYYKGTYDPEKNTPYEIENGVVWATYKPANYSLKTVRMFIRPAAF
ncbi:fibrinogen alpha chain-like isoform X3 [Siniperca chuatsi]|uniref:fibrinogen alpha chain-like isoform X3 n=1 Tax=Siniperca chuatsi TaxID=119488 RepID=UPI001CE1F259|nr:fibrinogen alpha chain-like isoform X3 [Siniperca chuatsi]